MEKVNEAVAEPIENPNPEEVIPAKGKKEKDHWELHDYLWLISIITGIVSILFVLLAKNAINDKNNFVTFTFNFPWMAKAAVVKLEFLTGKFCSIIAGIFGVASLGCGVSRNLVRKQGTFMSYLLGIAATVLSVIAYLAAYFKG